MKHDNTTRNYSRLGLGTVQFGQAYGINNSTGQVSFDQVCSILSLAHEHGITFLDTSRNYGSSESVIRQAIKEVEKEFLICTKLDLPRDYKELDDASLIKAVDASLTESLETLDLETIPLYLLHTYDYYAWKDHLVWNRLLQWQQKGVIKTLGISIGNGPHEALSALDDKTVSAMQIPFNALDQRWKRSGFLAKKDSVTVITRSAYLQGLLLMDLDKAMDRLPGAVPWLRTFHDLASAWNMSLKELAFSYVLGTPEIDVTIIGVDTLEQLKENIALLSRSSLSETQRITIEEQLAHVPVDIVNPSLWSQHR
ncbi:MAG: aldo/keto reductase [Sphaerochaetaceae bacterium]|nr:aldo/keto reductase [Sphaerochaetaceae bacterium]MDD4259686.1 aldo/keto reductase [Sphaerochaetaceae bacterium]MDD4842033.1 aldo/keto reductase [Sphaerochaetaceae bacterium]